MRIKKIAAVLAAVVAVSCAGAEKKNEEIAAALRATLGKRPAFVTNDEEGKRLWKLTQTFYNKREYEPAWIEDAEPRAQMEALSKALWSAEHEGLDPQLYNVSMLDARRQEASKGFLTKKGFDPREAGTLDVWLTYLYLKYASDLADGLSDLAKADPTWKIQPEKFDPLAHLEKALEDNHITESLDSLKPENAQYAGMRKALADYRAIAKKGGWGSLPANLRLKPNQTHAAVPALAKRLEATGDYTGRIPAEGQPAQYTTDLVEAVKRFQRRHGLQDDGIIGAPTVAEMNVPVEQRVQQLELNLERWRWLPNDLGKRHILVNIPEYRLEVWDGDEVPLTMRVVVGKEDTQTPIFADQMTHIVFSPYWNVPPDIATDETLPAVMSDPSFLERQNMEVLDKSGNVVDPSNVDLSDPSAYRFRQRPGASNSLGLVKFMFPNQFNVYLHDTPADSLFARATRSYSHGCVRLEQPKQLAEYLLRDQSEWTSQRIDEAMHAGEEKHVKLKTPIPVYLGYWTARVSADGIVQFRKDVYGVDGRQMTLLKDRLKRLRDSAAAAVAMTMPKAQPSSGGKASGL
jgi:murein L,D-transpeptidase YcbB/YkuD